MKLFRSMRIDGKDLNPEDIDTLNPNTKKAAAAKIADEVEKLAKPVETKDLLDIATVSVGGNVEMGKNIAEVGPPPRAADLPRAERARCRAPARGGTPRPAAAGAAAAGAARGRAGRGGAAVLVRAPAVGVRAPPAGLHGRGGAAGREAFFGANYAAPRAGPGRWAGGGGEEAAGAGRAGGTPRVPFEMHRRHRERLLERLRPGLAPEERGACLALFQGGQESPVYDTDTVWDFRQESNFQWLFGVREPGCSGALDPESGEALLFVPRLPEDYEAWVGPRRGLQWFRDTYEVDGVFFVDEMASVMKARGAESLLAYHGLNRDSGLRLPSPRFEGCGDFRILSDGRLWDALAECRVVKDEDELAILHFVNDVSSDAHVAVMRGVRPGDPEYVSEASFRHFAFLRGCARVGYHCICPSGARCGILHYGHAAFPNAEEVRPGELKLHDMGAEYHCYTADITCTFPVDGRFTAAQRTVYEAVWAATLAVERTMRPGVSYCDMHLL
ncbi:unnamed protein product, partial [Prorocentrum cordatum]